MKLPEECCGVHVMTSWLRICLYGAESFQQSLPSFRVVMRERLSGSLNTMDS